MNIRLISVGKIKEKYLREGIAEYTKRLSRYCKLTFVQTPDEKTPEGAPKSVEQAILHTEGERILKQLREREYVIALAIEGQMLDSLQLADKLQGFGVSGISDIAFVIGGSLGLSKEVMERADESLSFSRMTFPHQLMQMILLEQIYRSFRIMHHEPYHK